MATIDPKSVDKSAQSTAKSSQNSSGKPIADEDDLLEEALEETFPASDPMSSMHFTSSNDKSK
jgi:hypothetical protein